MAYRDEVLADSPWLYWRLEEASGAPQDETANNRDGTITATVTQGVTPGATADSTKAVTFDGATGKIISAATLAPTQITVEVWVKIPSTPASNGYLWTFTDGVGGGGSYETFINTSRRVQCRLWVGSEVITPDTGTQLVAGQWHHVVFRHDNSTAKFYVDGSETSTIAAGAVVDTRAFSLGGTGGSGQASSYAYSADEAAVYASALSPTRIADHFNAASGAGGGGETGGGSGMIRPGRHRGRFPGRDPVWF